MITYNENATNGLLCSSRCGSAPVTCPLIQTAFIPCPPNSHTNGTGSSSLYACACNQGYYGFPACTICPLNAYCPVNATAPVPCPASLVPGADPALQFSTSDVGSTSINDCTCPFFAIQRGSQCIRCPAGSYIFNNTCLPCPANNFCPGNGLFTPCSRWSVCPAGSAGVGLQCANNSFFEPTVVSTVSTAWPVRGLANATDVRVPTLISSTPPPQSTNVSSSSSPIIVGGRGVTGCVDGTKPLFTNIVDAVAIRSLSSVGAGGNSNANQSVLIWVSDEGCGAVRVVISNQTAFFSNQRVVTVLKNINGSYALLALPDGLLMVAGASQLWAINPSTLVARALMAFSPSPISLAVLTLPNLPNYVVLAGTAANNISFISSANWTVVDSMRTPSPPNGLAYADGVLYTDGLTVYQMSPGGGGINAWIDFFSLDLGMRNFLPPTYLPSVGPAHYLDWNVQNNGALTVGMDDRISVIDVCTACPNNATTSGTYRPGLSRCQCASGLYLMSGGAGCVACISGAYCPFGTITPTVCPAGFWCGPGQSAPTPCDPSVYCGEGSVDQFGHGPGQSGAPACSAGYYRGAMQCLRCPNGSTTGGTGATSIADCACGSIVVAGRTLYTFLNVSSGGCSVCPATDYCPFGCYSPIPCPPGTFCGEGTLQPTVCPVGFYCPGGVPYPLSCEAGTYCPTGSGTRLACTRGAYCPLQATNELPCPSGYYCPTGSPAPSACPAGSYCVANASTPSACTGGYYCTAGVSSGTACPSFSTSAASAASSSACYCIASHYYFTFLDLTGACVACPQGAFSLPGSRNFSDCACDTGYKISTDLTQCIACAASEYCPGGAARACPAGYVCTARSAGLCPLGFYCPGALAGSLSPAPIACAAGTYCPVGSASPLNCTGGYYCPGGPQNATMNQTLISNISNSDTNGTNASSSTPSPIPVFPPPSLVPVLCPGGAFCPPASAYPIICPAGSQCAPGSVSAAIPCTAGQYCPVGSAVGVPCPSGAFCPPGASIALVCPPGRFCPPNAAAPTLCPHGSFCPLGASDAAACPGGYVCQNTGMSAPVPCPAPGTVYCPAASFETHPCGPNMTTLGNRSLPSSEMDCMCVPGTYLYDSANPVMGCGPCPAGGSYFQPDSTRAEVCIRCDAGTSVDGTDCPPATPPSAPLGAIVGGAAAVVAVGGVGASLYLFVFNPSTLMQAGQTVASNGLRTFAGMVDGAPPPSPRLFQRHASPGISSSSSGAPGGVNRLFTDITLLTPSSSPRYYGGSGVFERGHGHKYSPLRQGGVGGDQGYSSGEGEGASSLWSKRAL